MTDGSLTNSHRDSTQVGANFDSALYWRGTCYGPTVGRLLRLGDLRQPAQFAHATAVGRRTILCGWSAETRNAFAASFLTGAQVTTDQAAATT